MNHIKLFEAFESEEFMTPAEFGMEINKIVSMDNVEAMLRAAHRLNHDHPYAIRSEIASKLGCPYPTQDYLNHIVRISQALDAKGLSHDEIKAISDSIKGEITKDPSMWGSKYSDTIAREEAEEETNREKMRLERVKAQDKAFDDYKSGAISKEEFKMILGVK